jgi:hypothetical protein
MKRTNEFGITGEQAEDQAKPAPPAPIEEEEEAPKPVKEKKND